MRDVDDAHVYTTRDKYNIFHVVKFRGVLAYHGRYVSTLCDFWKEWRSTKITAVYPWPLNPATCLVCMAQLMRS